MIRETKHQAVNGLLALVVLLAAIAFGLFVIGRNAAQDLPLNAIPGFVLVAVALLCLGGLFVVNPNEGRVLTLFGKYVGTVKVPGLWWVNPFMAKKKVSLRVRNFETGKLKVNDANSNPIEIAAVVVWKVVDTAEAMFEVDDYEHYVKVQSESAVRTLASAYPYDAHNARRGGAQHAHGGGVEAAARGSAGAARQGGRGGDRGADQPPGLLAGDRLGDAPAPAGQRHHRGAAEDRGGRGRDGRDGAGACSRRRRSWSSTRSGRRAMVSNLLVVLCCERGTQPVVNTGTLYQ